MTTPAAVLAELAMLRKQNALQAQRLQRMGVERKQQRVERMIDKALLDALALITVHVGGGCIDRDTAPLPQRRWAHAVALLRLAGLAHGRTVTLQLAQTPQETLQRLERAATLAKAQPWQWAKHMPAYNRPRGLQGPR